MHAQEYYEKFVNIDGMKIAYKIIEDFTEKF